MTTMKKLISTTIDRSYLDIAILILRICVGSFMLTHGLKKFDMLFADTPVEFADPIGVGQFPSLVLTVFAEVFCSILLIAGFWTRLATIPLMITMLVAVLVIHSGDPFGKQEMGLLYLLIYFTLLVTGGGRYSVDRVLENRRSPKK